VLVPREHGPHEFRSIEDIDNHLLRHPAVRAHVKERGGKAKLILVMFDQETGSLAKEIGATIAHPPAKLRIHLGSKIVTTQFGNEARIPSAPNTLGRAATYAELRALARKAKLGDNLVVQTPYGDPGCTTFFVKSQADWDKNADVMAKEELKVMKRINHLPGCQRRRDIGPLWRSKKGPLGVCSLSRYSMGGTRARRSVPLDGMTRRRAWEGPVDPRGQADTGGWVSRRRAARASSVKSNTRCEIVLRRGLWRRGLRYRIHHPGLPGLSVVRISGTAGAVL